MSVTQIVPFNEDQLEVSKVYESFLKSNARNSERTAGEYQSRIEEFFKMTLGKPVKYLDLNDINSIKYSDVKLYVDDLTKRGNTDKTIETKLYTVKSFYNELLKNDMKVNPTIFKIKLNKKEKHHESLSFEELDMLYEFMKNEKDKQLEKYLLVKTLFITGNRISATCKMTWNESFVQKIDIDTGKKVWVVTVIDKGKKKVEKPIPDEFYAELQQLNKGQDKVFSIAVKTLERALERFSERIGKKITPHSLKATGVTLGYRLTKDINLCKQYASHEDISTTSIYLSEEKSYVKQLSYNMTRSLDDSLLTAMSKEDLIRFIMDEKNKDIKNSILLRLG